MVAGLASDTTPHTPPTTDQDRLCRLRLIRSRRVGPITFQRLIAEHGSAAAALAALPDIARASGVEGYAPCSPAVALQEMQAGRAAGARLICLGEADYPAALAEVADAPPVIWARGDTTLLSRPMVALVGARNASSLGLRMARRLAEGLAEAGFVVVSGLARGIDAEAHRAALAGGTVAVLAGGVDVVYPAENAALADSIAAQGCLISEQPPGLDPQARHFPLRNRIVSGMARALVVVEAAARSGSLITAKEAADQGREVFVVPGHPFDARAAGCNALIREGATLVRSAADVLETLGVGQGVRPPKEAPVATPQKAPVAASRGPTPLAALPDLILSRLSPSPVAEDQLIRDLSLPASEVMPQLLALELEGRLIRQPGGLVARA